MRVLEVWPERHGAWRWRYRDEGMEAQSNRVFPGRAEAEESARLSYPGVPLRRLRVRARARSAAGRVGVAALLVGAGVAVLLARRRRPVRVRPFAG